MPVEPADPIVERELDVRAVPRERRHPLVFEAYEQLAAGHALVLVNDHEPRHLREEFERDLAGSFSWEPEPAAEKEYRVRITKRARTPLPRVVADTAGLLAAAGPDAAGSIWHLEPSSRDLDSNVIALAAGGEIRAHDGPELDVLVFVLRGSGELETERSVIPLRPGELIWLPRRARRRFTAGSEGVAYLTLHHRKPTLSIITAPAS